MPSRLRAVAGSPKDTPPVSFADSPLREEGAWEGSRELTAPDSFGGLYLRWLEAQIDLYNGEPERYNGSIALFNAEFHAFESWYNRTFLPKNGGDWRG